MVIRTRELEAVRRVKRFWIYRTWSGETEQVGLRKEEQSGAGVLGRHELQLEHPRKDDKYGSSGITPDLGILGGLSKNSQEWQGPSPLAQSQASPFPGLLWTGWELLA